MTPDKAQRLVDMLCDADYTRDLPTVRSSYTVDFLEEVTRND